MAAHKVEVEMEENIQTIVGINDIRTANSGEIHVPIVTDYVTLIYAKNPLRMGIVGNYSWGELDEEIKLLQQITENDPNISTARKRVIVFQNPNEREIGTKYLSLGLRRVLVDRGLGIEVMQYDPFDAKKGLVFDVDKREWQFGGLSGGV